MKATRLLTKNECVNALTWIYENLNVLNPLLVREELKNVIESIRPQRVMDKETFIDTFAHFMSDKDLNEAYDSHFKELGRMNYYEIKAWLEEVLKNEFD